MKLELMDEITLNTDEKYMVVNITNVDSREYYLLVNKLQDIMIGYIDGDEFVSIQDNYKFNELLTKFDPNKVLKKYSNIEIDEEAMKELSVFLESQGE